MQLFPETLKLRRCHVVDSQTPERVVAVFSISQNLSVRGRKRSQDQNLSKSKYSNTMRSSIPPQLKILRTYAKLDDASLLATLPPTIYFSHTPHTLTIFDAYPKALFHFLVLPRLRIPATSSSKLPPLPPAEDSEDGDEDERRRELERDSEEVKVVADRTEDLTSLRTLLQHAGPDAARARVKGTLSVLSDEATRLQSQIEREMQTHHGFKWPIWIGFHAIPSME
jgi:aprataxin